jgi:hypothetical protein
MDESLFPTEVSLRGPLPDDNQEAFAHGFVAYNANGVLAYAHAYGISPADVDRVHVAKLLQAPHIAARVRQLKELADDVLLLSKVNLAMEYADIRELSKSVHDFNAAIKAQDRIAALAGQLEKERANQQPQQQPAFVINMPPPAITLQEWMAAQGVNAPMIQNPAIEHEE